MTALTRVVANTLIVLSVVAVTTKTWAEKRTAPRNEGLTVERAKSVAVVGFKDPDSAQFKNLTKVKKVNGESGVCGWINAKNSYGGYVGFRRFAVILLSNTAIPLPIVPESDEHYSKQLVKRFCDTDDNYKEAEKNAISDAT